MRNFFQQEYNVPDANVKLLHDKNYEECVEMYTGTDLEKLLGQKEK